MRGLVLTLFRALFSLKLPSPNYRLPRSQKWIKNVQGEAALKGSSWSWLAVAILISSPSQHDCLITAVLPVTLKNRFLITAQYLMSSWGADSLSVLSEMQFCKLLNWYSKGCLYNFNHCYMPHTCWLWIFYFFWLIDYRQPIIKNIMYLHLN